MSDTIIVWDLETVPDISAAGRVLRMPGYTEPEIREAMGESFPKLPLHKIVCIGALIVKLENKIWKPKALGAPHIGERSETELIAGFVEKIAELNPQLVSFNGNAFDLPVLRYRAMLNLVSAPGLAARPYFHRYTEDALDLCDALSSFDGRSKMKLDELCKILKLHGKPEGIDGSQVEGMVSNGQISEVAAYCESDIVNTYQVWLRYRLFVGSITASEFTASSAAMNEYLRIHVEKKPYLHSLLA